MMEEIIRFELNGKSEELQIDPNLTLLWVLRDHFGLTGTKFGCGIGFCGACTVHMDHMKVPSCQLRIGNVNDRKITTIEGLSPGGELHPVQKAFIKHDALQCGFCTSGMIMSASGLLLKNPKPAREEIIREMDHNLCRCGAHTRIIDAVLTASEEINAGK
jgi:aerobic-type carbon monoxide dehydrogenase small subunit (CoxS/CutS family)